MLLELLALDMYVNQKKSMCIRFGRRFSVQCAELVTASGGRLRWVDRCRYLGVYFTSGTGCSFRYCLEDAKSRFFRAFNAIFSKTDRCASELVILSFAVNACLFYCMLLRHVHYWLDKFSQLNLH